MRLNLLIIATGLMILTFISPNKISAEIEFEEKINHESVRMIASIENDGETLVFYRNDSDGGYLYKYNDKTKEHTRLNESISANIAVQLEGNDVVVYYTNASDINSLYSYNDTTKIHKKHNNVASGLIRTSNGLVFYVNGGDGSRHTMYNPITNEHVRVSTGSANAGGVIFVDELIKTYYRNSASGSRFDRVIFNTDTKTMTGTVLSTHNADSILPISTNDGILVFYRNNSVSGSLYVYEENKNIHTRLTTNSAASISVVEKDGEILVYYMNSSDNFSLYEYNYNKKENRRLSNQWISDISAINTTEGIKIFFRNESDLGSLYKYSIITMTYEDVSNLKHSKNHSAIYLNWDNPTQENFTSVKIYKDGQFVQQLQIDKNEHYFRNLTPDTEYSFLITASYSFPDYETKGVQATIKTDKLPEVGNVKTSADFEKITISFENPIIDDFFYVEVTANEIVKDSSLQFVEFNNLQEDTDYQITIKVVNRDSHKSDGVILNIKTPLAPKKPEIINLKANAKHNRVDLSWNNPNTNPNFNFVRIYRNRLSSEQISFIESLLGEKVFANGGFEPLFETNGTYFNDLTVKPSTTYEYLLTTENKEGQESEGVTIQVTTAEEEPPRMGGVNETTNEDGDFVFSWSSPTDGQVKIFVGGTEYTTVDASLGQIVIPAEDMKYNMFNNPDVTLQPISATGKEGKKSSPGLIGGSWGDIFSANEFLKATMNFIMLVGPFVLLAIAVRFTPRIIKLIKQSLGNRRFKT